MQKKAKITYGNTFPPARRIYQPRAGRDCITGCAALYAVPWQGASDQADGMAAVTGAKDGKAGPRDGQTGQPPGVAAAT